MLTPEDIHFILRNEAADTTRLLLGKQRQEVAGIHLSLCVKCIEARRKLKEKIPLWYACPELVYPFPLSVEQCSSQATAQYKQALIAQIADTLQAVADTHTPTASTGFITADLTGGMGVDSYFLSRMARQHYYIERNAELCTAAAYNFKMLGAENISVIPAECLPGNRELFAFLSEQKLSLIYTDPARRSKTQTKVISLQDYEPNLLELKEELFRLAPFVLVKISPMADIRQTLQWLPETVQIHVVSVNNECKELLFLLASPDREEGVTFRQAAVGGPILTAVDLAADPTLFIRFLFRFTLPEEEQASAPFAANLGTYLYEPGKAILKSGAYKLLAQRTGLQKLAPSTHLYTNNASYPNNSASNNPCEDFPGKTYPILCTVDFNKKILNEIAEKYPCADLSARNFPLDTNGLKKLSGIRDGGSHHLFAVTLANGEKKIIICEKAIK